MIAAPPPAALAVSPARLALAGGGSGAVEVRNVGDTRIVVVPAAAGYALDERGRPHAISRRDRVALVVRPATVVVPAGRTARVVVAARIAPRASPGDHAELLLLATRPVARGSVGIRLRIGVPIVVRVAGAVVHRLVVARVAVRDATLRVVVRNRGNVVERLAPSRVHVRLVRRGQVAATLRSRGRELLPGADGVLLLRLPRRLEGRFQASITIGNGHPRSWTVDLP